MNDPTAGFVQTARHDTYPAIDPATADLTGKVVLITGASKGIGRATAIAFAQAGVSGLILLARSDTHEVGRACEEAQRPGQQLRVLHLSVDTSDGAAVADAVVRVRETFGRLDIVINNAGIVGLILPIRDSDPNNWEQVWKVNMNGTYLVTRAFLPLLIECGGDRTIINTASTAGLAPSPYNTAYGLSKLAVMRFSENVSVEHAKDGIISYSVHPGYILSDMTEASVPQDWRHMLVDTFEVAAHTLTWLVRERREWLAGRFVSSQWDVEELLGKKDEIVAGDKLKMKLVL